MTKPKSVDSLSIRAYRYPVALPRSITPRLFVRDVPAQLEFLRSTFSAEVTQPDFGPAQVRIGDSIILVGSDEVRGTFPVFLYIYVDDVEATHLRALKAGASQIEPPLDTPYGDRRSTFGDPWGSIYQVARPLL